MNKNHKQNMNHQENLTDSPLSTEKLRALFLISRKINQITDIKNLLDEILHLAVSNIEAERGLIILTDGTGDIYRTVASESLDEKEITFSRSIIQQTIKNNKMLISIDVQQDRRFKNSDSIKGLHIMSFVSVPLTISTRRHPIGILYIDQRMNKKLFSNDEIAFLKAFANLAAIAITNANLTEQLKAEKSQLLQEVGKKYSFPSVIGQGQSMQHVLNTIQRILNDNCTVLLTGESGTGKDVIAKAIHYNGVRKDKSFIAINCGALPETLLEVELFGSTRGAYTGAVDKIGLLQAADGGTVFLDEISHTSKSMQVKLLRFLQDREIRRIGGTRSIKIDVRLICASNENLLKAVEEGKFRKDFYYRINIVTLNIPALREHKEDIPLLAEHFLQKHCAEKNKRGNGFSMEALEALIDYDWSENNIRELENEILRIAIFLTDNSMVQLNDLSDKIRNNRSKTTFSILSSEGKPGRDPTFEEFEKQYILSILSKTHGNKVKASKIMGIPRSTLMGKMRRLKLL